MRKMNNPIRKWAEGLNRRFSKKTYRWLVNTWKDAWHFSLLENCKSKTQWGIISHRSEWPSSKSLQTINAGEGVEKREHSCTVGGNMNWYSHYGRWYGDSLKKLGIKAPWVHFSSVAQSCLTLCDPMNCSTPGLPVHYQLLEFTQTHVHQVSDAIQPSHPLSSPYPPAPNPSQHQSLF